jgi:hypothetical protein
VRVKPSWRSRLAAPVALALAGCGGSGPSHTTAAATAATQASLCALLTGTDLQRVSGRPPARIESLQHVPGSDLRCASLFIDGSGGLILELTESPATPGSLPALRRTVAEAQGRPSAVRALGPGAFVARRELGFVHRGQLITLQAGYSQQGRLELTRAQLVTLAKTASTRG